MSKIFVTSDTHFGHANIIRRWNSRVAEGNVVYFLGDFAMGRGVDANYITNVLSQLNGDCRYLNNPKGWE